jgi:GT2 family glycosyltransferase
MSDCLMSDDVSVVLSGFRRLHYLPEQLAAVRAQTVPPAEILVWNNDPDDGTPRDGTWQITHEGTRAAHASCNFGVWARFAYALNAKSPYVCVFDDDTVPGPRWIESCLRHMSEREALYGTIGILYTNPQPPWSAGQPGGCSYYESQVKIGWYDTGNRDFPAEVDLVGHAWFFKRAWLSTFWRELPPPDVTLCGEDMHFSFMLQKYLGVPTIVPPHPSSDRSVWGSVKGELGMDEHSLWNRDPATKTGTFRADMDKFFQQQRRKGWRLVNERSIP